MLEENMREKQVLIMPIDNKYKFRNMLWSDALAWAKTDDEGLTEIIEKGIEVNRAYVDEALVYDNSLS